MLGSNYSDQKICYALRGFSKICGMGKRGLVNKAFTIYCQITGEGEVELHAILQSVNSFSPDPSFPFQNIPGKVHGKNSHWSFRRRTLQFSSMTAGPWD